MQGRLSRHDVMVLSVAYDLKRRDIIADERIAATWNEPADELVAWLSHRHGWRAELSVSYLTTMLQLERTRPHPSHTTRWRVRPGSGDKVGPRLFLPRRDVEPAVQLFHAVHELLCGEGVTLKRKPQGAVHLVDLRSHDGSFTKLQQRKRVSRLLTHR